MMFWKQIAARTLGAHPSSVVCSKGGKRDVFLESIRLIDLR